MEKAIFKFNNGNGALLCSNCRVIIKTGKDYTKKEKEAACGDYNLPPQYCDKCKQIFKYKSKRSEIRKGLRFE